MQFTFNDVVWWGFDCSLIMNVSFLSPNILKMYEMQSIRQINKYNYPFSSGAQNWWNERWYDTTMNIHIFRKECIRGFKFGMMIHHCLLSSFVYSIMSYDLDRNFQGHMPFWNMIIYSEASFDQTFQPNRDPVTEMDINTFLTLIPNSGRFP